MIIDCAFVASSPYSSLSHFHFLSFVTLLFCVSSDARRGSMIKVGRDRRPPMGSTGIVPVRGSGLWDEIPQEIATFCKLYYGDVV